MAQTGGPGRGYGLPKARKVRRKPPAPRSEVAAAGGVGRPKAKPVYGPPTPKPKVKRVAPSKSPVFGAVGRQGAANVKGGPQIQRARKVARRQEQRAQAQVPNRSVPEVRTIPRGEPKGLHLIPGYTSPGGHPTAAGISGVHVVDHPLIHIGPLKLGHTETYQRNGQDVTGQVLAQRRARNAALEDPTTKFIKRKVTAPAVKVLGTATIPSHAIAGLAAGKSIGYGIRHHTTFKDVLAKHGVKGALGTVAGFALDVGTDPTTYATFGVGGVGAKAAEKVARSATEDALARGLSKKAADRAGRAAARVALDTKGGKGIQAGLRFHVPLTDHGIHLQTSGRATAAIGRKLAKPAAAIRNRPVVQGLGRSLVHDFRPMERTPQQHAVIRAAEREHRAGVAESRRRVVRRVSAYSKALPKQEDQRAVADAIEANDFSALTDTQAKAAGAIQKDLHQAHQMTYSRGIGTEKFRQQAPEDAAGYFPHYRQRDLEPGGKPPSHGGTTRVSAAQGRTIRKPLSTLRAEGANTLFSENVPRVIGVKLAREHERASLHDFWQKIASTGHPLTPKATYDPSAEMVYRVTPHGLEALSKEAGTLVDHAKVQAALQDRADKYVILNRRTVEDVKKRLGSRPAGGELAHAFDHVQGTLKTLYTVPNPSYHARNLLGDSLNAFIGDASAKSFVDAYRTLRVMAKRNKAERSSLDGHVHALHTPINLGKAGKTTLGQELALAERHGATSGGFVGRELPDLVGKQGRLSRAAQYREDLPRLASYLSARKRGMNPSQAADWSLQHHFDYGDLTPAERDVARRVIPFWTFFAHNTRLQATKILTRPGKYATFGKILDDSAQAAGFDSYDHYTGSLKNYQQRGLPIPVKVGGKVYSVQVGPPQTDLNQLTTSYTQFAQDIANRVSFFKTLAEVPLNYSTFFQQPISPEGNELTNAPPDLAAAVAQIPPLKKLLGVQKVGGKWQWTRKADYVARSLPEGNLATSLFGGENPLRQQTRGQTIAGVLTGAKIQQTGTPQQQYSRLNQALHDGQVKADRMRRRQQAVDRNGNATPAYRRQLDLNKAMAAERDRMRQQLKLPAPKRLKRQRRSSSPLGSGGLGRGGLGAGGLGKGGL